LKKSQKFATIRPVLARQILIRRSARCFSSLTKTTATPVVAPSGRFSARSAADSAANLPYAVLPPAGPFLLLKAQTTKHPRDIPLGVFLFR
jgi:hypothetical protein